MWRMRQRWRDLLFAHYPIEPKLMASLIPAGLELDTHDGAAWAGVVPFWMDHVETRIAGQRTLVTPTVSAFNELNLRTYVTSPRTGKRGVYFFSLDCSSPLAVIGARTLFRLPYFFAGMDRAEHNGHTLYRSRRLGSSAPRFRADFRPTGPVQLSTPGSLAAFLTERYCLFTPDRFPHAGRILCGDIHHDPWPLQPAQADIAVDEIPAAHGIALPDVSPVLHFSRALEVYIWPLVPDVQA